MTGDTCLFDAKANQPPRVGFIFSEEAYADSFLMRCINSLKLPEVARESTRRILRIRVRTLLF